MVKKPTLNDLSHQELSSADKAALIVELLSGTDRATALVGCTAVEYALARALCSRLVPMADAEIKELFFKPNAVLGSFSARITMGRAVGIYAGKMQAMLDCIRRIRNAFAHAFAPLTFENELILDQCGKLPATTLDQAFNPETLQKAGISAEGVSEPRARYISTCLQLQVVLNDHANRHWILKKAIDIPDETPA